MKIRENIDVIVEKHPHHESLNKNLMDDVKRFHFFPPEQNSHYTNIQATQYNVRSHDVTSSMRTVMDWVKHLLARDVDFLLGPAEHTARSNINIWFARYNKGDYTQIHYHLNYALYGFVYFVNTPKGSSPLVFTTSGKRIKSEAGKIVIFPSCVLHHIPLNKSDNRLVLAGNVGFVDSLGPTNTNATRYS